MREIKFRAWDTNIKTMFSMKQLLLRWNTLSILTCPYFKIMQYTGIKDGNGVEIFEGDIVKEGDINSNCFYDSKYVVEWDESEAMFIKQYINHEPYAYYSSLNTCHDLVVLGNIYNNQELLV